MTRTRTLFYLILAVFLAIIAVSLALEMINAAFLSQLFIASAIFSIAVVAMDFLGVLGSHDSGDGDALHGLDSGGGDHGGGGFDHGDAGFHDGGAGFDHGDAGFHDSGAGFDHGGVGDHAGGAADDAGGEGGDSGDDGHGASEGVDHGSPVLSILAYLRMLVYFCLGFGPTGWAALISGRSPLLSLVIAIPVGVLSTLLAQAFFRIQRSDTDSTLARRDLRFKEATVIVPLGHQDMGKVRIKVGMSVTEQYALAALPDEQFRRGDLVRVVEISDDCVYVAK